MMSLGPLAFAAPWALAALAVLPAIWWLLRLTPPVPKRVLFPPIRLLFGLTTERETSAQTPWWLLLLRLLIAALIIIAAAQPMWNAERDTGVNGPLVLVVDNGWASAARWDIRRDVAAALAERASRAGRQVVLLMTAPPSDGSAISVRAPGPNEIRAEIAKAIPMPWPTDRGQAAQALVDWGDSFNGLADVRWLSDGLDGPGVAALSERLQALGRVTVYGTDGLPVTVLRPPVSDTTGLIVRVERPYAVAVSESVEVRGLDGEGRVQVIGSPSFSVGETVAETTLTAPTEILNRIERVQIGSGAHVGAVVLLDQRWRRRPVGIVDLDGAAAAQPLLSNSYYIRRALEGSTSVRTGTLRALFEQPMSMLVIPDAFEIPQDDVAAIRDWVSAGGILVRFAGPALARRTSEATPGSPPEPLLPVTLRGGDRIIGGAMSWRQPMGLQEFGAETPFAGLAIPDDIRIRRQVLAQPAPDLAQKTWAALADGTPLVTSARRDAGWVVLFHTSPNATWSDLPLSGLFVEMMRRLSALGRGVEGGLNAVPLAPERILDGFARLDAPPATAQPITTAAIETDPVTQYNPPGIYAAGDLRRAFNLTTSMPTMAPLPVAPGWTEAAYVRPAERDLTGILFAVALVLFLVDMAAGLWVRTGGRRTAGRAATAAGLALLLTIPWAVSPVQADEVFAAENSLETRIAYLRTGNSRVDDVSALGLTGLTVMLARRTAAELGPPQAVEPGRDELSFFPLIYWPVTPDYELDDVATLAVKEYLRNGGTVLFDTQERGGSAQASALRQIVNRLDLPPLVPVAPPHVLTRAFYLLDDFPGRYGGGQLWVERAGERVNDGVSPIIAGSSDWAAAWAMDENQRPLYPVVPGGERQREMAYRFGINLVMYVLTGNYKADQVHMPAIIKRLGQ